MVGEILAKNTTQSLELISPSSLSHNSQSDIIAQLGPLVTRLARNTREVEAAQTIRFNVFVEEMQAKVPAEAMRLRRDIDMWDDVCDHLLVLDTSIEGDPEDQVVGTYRLLRQEVAKSAQGFYTSSEFDIEKLISRHPNKRFMELGRSCVLPNYRNKRTIELLWQGCWFYALTHKIDVMIGCASFSGVDPADHAQALSFLHYNAKADGEWAASPRPNLFQKMDLLDEAVINAKAAISEMPPLIKAYLRIGAKFGSGAVIDRAFNTTDVLVILPIDQIDERYINYYSAGLARSAA